MRHFLDEWTSGRSATPSTRASSEASDDDYEALRREAEQRVDQLQGFYRHAAIYVLVNTGLVAIDLMTSPGLLWAFWPILGWGIKLGAHAIRTFGGDAGPFASWRERKVQEYVIRKQLQRGDVDLDGFEDARTGAASRLDREAAGAMLDPESFRRLIKRIENLEAIVTQTDGADDDLDALDAEWEADRDGELDVASDDVSTRETSSDDPPRRTRPDAVSN